MSRPATTRLKLNPPLGNLPTLQFVRPSDIRVDPAYQRSLEASASQSLIRRMAQHWNWDLCQPLVLARRMAPAAQMFVIDGQHRLEAARLRGDIDQLPCVIVNYANPADEAASFVHLNQQRRPLTKLDLFKAAVASEDPEACALIAAMKEAGLSVAPHSNATVWKPGAVSNIGGLEAAWRRHGPRIASAAMKAMSAAFSGQVLVYAGSIFPGIAAICADENAEGKRLTDDAVGRVIAMLRKRSQAEWRKEIALVRASNPGRNFGDASAMALRAAWSKEPPTSPPPLPRLQPAPLPAPTFAPPKETDGKTFCFQCDHRVSLTAATLCKDRFCKVRPALSAAR